MYVYAMYLVEYIMLDYNGVIISLMSAFIGDFPEVCGVYLKHILVS